MVSKRSLTMILPEKKDSLSRIEKWMSNEESGITLTATEEKMMTRMMMANALLIEKKLTREGVALKIKEAFKISIYTARNDINNTYRLFSKVTEDYKRYTLIHHIEDINQKIVAWQNDKSLAPLLPKLYAEKTRAIIALPTALEAPDVPPPVIIINTTTGISSDMPIEDAILAADKLIEYEREQQEKEDKIIPDDLEE